MGRRRRQRVLLTLAALAALLFIFHNALGQAVFHYERVPVGNLNEGFCRAKIAGPTH